MRRYNAETLEIVDIYHAPSTVAGRRRSGMKPRSVVLRILDLLEDIDENGCWLFGGTINKRSGYGTVDIGGKDGRPVVAHRAMYEILVEHIPDGYEVDHLCKVRHCVNPSHLEAVTKAENIRRSDFDKGREAYYASRRAITECPRGHLYTPENTFYEKHGRRCRECNRIRLRDSRKK